MDKSLSNVGTNIEYKAISSTEGLKAVIAKQVDFGASDKPLSQMVQKNGLI